MTQNTIFTFPTTGFIQFSLTEEQLKPVKQEIQEIQQNFNTSVPRNRDLAGHIQREYSLTKNTEYLENILAPHVIEFENTFNHVQHNLTFEKNAPLVLTTPWVNFQQKHEFNPPHRHHGILSFVIWMNIPYNMEDEKQIFSSMDSPNPASFNFLYTDTTGEIKNYTVRADKSFEGTGFIFPASFMHYVNPFQTSDQYRISISGNFMSDV